MGEPKPVYKALDVRFFCGEYWVFVYGSPYRKAQSHEIPEGSK